MRHQKTVGSTLNRILALDIRSDKADKKHLLKSVERSDCPYISESVSILYGGAYGT